MVLTMKEKKSVVLDVAPRYQKARKKDKRVIAPDMGQLLQAQNSGESLWKAKGGLGDYYGKILNNRAS